MGKLLRVFTMGVGLMGFATTALAQSYDLQFVEMSNTGTELVVKIQVKSNTSTFRMGDANLVFDYTGSLDNPVLSAAHNFHLGSYDSLKVTTPGANRVSLNVVYGLSAGSGTEVLAGYMDVATLQFDITGGGTADFVWHTTAPNRTNVWMDNNTTEVSSGALSSYTSSPLPIQLASFDAAVVNSAGHVLLEWMTISETNNYGFEIEKSTQTPPVFEVIAGSFVPGNGTTLDPQHYTFSDVTGTPGSWYRLKQIDLDGTVHFSDGVQPSGLTDVKLSQVPDRFALEQNYPNPFNPETIIQFAVPTASHVKLEVYNILGQKVATLIDEVKSAGYYQATFNGSGFSSGLYFYRLVSEEVSFLKKMMLVK